MAYGAVCCLELIIERLLKSSHISVIQNSSPQILKHLYDEILSLKEALGEFDERRSTINMKMVKTLEAGIIDAIYEFEDVLEPHVTNQFHSQSEKETNHPPLMVYSVDLHEIKQDVDSFIQTMNKMKRAYIHELHNPSPDDEEEEEDDSFVSSRIDFGGKDESYNMVGSSDLFKRIKDRLTSSQSETTFVSLLGMAGIGKTTLAKKLFQDPFIVSRYTARVFVTIGPKYRFSDILVDILRQLNAPGIDEVVLVESENVLGELKMMVYKSLKNLRFLVVFDDVWDRELYFGSFPNNQNGSRVLLTTRIAEVAQSAHPLSTFKIPFLDKKESWNLLREKVFGEQESFSYELAKAGKKIAENCEGLPLTIVTVANILPKADKTLEYWNKIANEKQNSVYKDAYDQMSKVLYPSYDYLDQHLKACFLCIGAFPQNCLKYPSQLIDLWSAEGFLNLNGTDVYMGQLFSRNVILFDAKTCAYHLHSSFWYMCNKEATKTKLFYALNCPADALPEEGIKSKRRLCIRNNVLLAMEDVQKSIASASTVRSLICTGPFHRYPVKLFLEDLWLLRVLHAYGIKFYEFPMEVVKLVQLRHLDLVYGGTLPTFISKLRNLQQLIVKQHQIIVKSTGNISYMPIEIWNMKELKYLQTAGRDMPHPCGEGSLLPNLLKLNAVGPQSCNKYTTEVVTPLAPLSDIPSSLTELILCGFGYPWEEIIKISSLPNLKYLTLDCYAFRGPKWEVLGDEFPKLESLQIEGTDLEQCTSRSYCCLPAILSVRIANCYKLKEIPLAFGTSIRSMQVDDCSTKAVECANKINQDWEEKYGDKNLLSVYVRSSWDDSPQGKK
ncbi:hypothetical protein MIMGU_mgv1a001335mg [Erythranthe guttata]|uniref:Uncharacterized protein n=1 Tax=Erythranthe guttata TaxID=4155 RepID=A0A022PSD9_ERYGU|nr:hypothetical protein MIMGU_mgv1a001335mg [Erythranthe guttata]